MYCGDIFIVVTVLQDQNVYFSDLDWSITAIFTRHCITNKTFFDYNVLEFLCYSRPFIKRVWGWTEKMLSTFPCHPYPSLLLEWVLQSSSSCLEPNWAPLVMHGCVTNNDNVVGSGERKLIIAWYQYKYKNIFEAQNDLWARDPPEWNLFSPVGSIEKTNIIESLVKKTRLTNIIGWQQNQVYSTSKLQEGQLSV